LGIARWREVAAQLDDPELADFARALADHPDGRAVLDPLFANSPFLGDCFLSDAAFARTILARGPNEILTTIHTETRQELLREADVTKLMRGLRIAKRRMALAVGMADIFATWTLEQVTNALTDFAELALSLAVTHLLRKAAANKAFELPNGDDIEAESGLVVLGMGKLGARELNYSSDIDLILLYDRERIRTADDDKMHQAFVRLARDLVKILEERTAHGYVFRTDLRLRPDPGITPMAMSVEVAESYYGSVGQNWERAAMIKARAVAGDQEAARRFLQRIRPFVWRRHLDFAAIQDIHSIKRQIAAHRGGHTIAIKGHNIKLGRGGIREIEFIAQTLQLIWGGREPELRIAPTCEALSLMAKHVKLEMRIARDLINAYRFLRKLEHRLQMVDDKQTHTMPADDKAIAQIAAFMAYDDPASFVAELEKQLRTVEKHYAGLFEAAPTLGAAPDAKSEQESAGEIRGNLVFTGTENDPDTLVTLKSLGFSDPPSVADRIRSWHHGRYRAMRSARAREILTELKPALLGALARTASPDQAFARFDEFLGQLPAGVQILSLFQSNPRLLDLVAEIMGSAPPLAEQLARNPILLDGVLGAGFAEEAPGHDALAAELDQSLARADDFQDVLDLCRRWTNDHKFHLGMRMLRGQTDAHAAGPVFSEVASIAIDRMLKSVTRDFSSAHGRFRDAGLGAIALGKLGAREMSVGSDLDLILVYGDTAAEASDGPKQLAPMVYFARLSQRLITALTAPTGEGKLYEVDMRLRPSGNQGPIASSLAGFAKYQEQDAWTWEHMALTRARPIAGPVKLHTALEEMIRGVLTRRRDPDKLVIDIADMRQRMAKEFRAQDIFDIKHARGGLVDCDFIAQYLQLRHAHDHPGVLDTNTCEALRKLAAQGLLDRVAAEDLIEATAMWHRVQGLLRLTVGKGNVREAPEGVRRALAMAGRVGDFAALEARMQELAEKVRAQFEALIDKPAAAARARRPVSDDKSEEKKG